MFRVLSHGHILKKKKGENYNCLNKFTSLHFLPGVIQSGKFFIVGCYTN